MKDKPYKTPKSVEKKQQKERIARGQEHVFTPTGRTKKVKKK